MSNEFREYSQFFQKKSNFPNYKDFNKTKNNLDISYVCKGIVPNKPEPALISCWIGRFSTDKYC